MMQRIRRPARALAVLLALLGAPCGPAAGPSPREPHRHDATTRHRFDDVEHWVRRFDDPARDRWQKPEEVLRFLGIGAGMRVADLGAGTGYFAVRIARAVGSEGTVWAVDVEPKLVEYLASRARSEDLDWLRPVLAAPDDPRLPDGAVDLVLVVNTWHHLDDRLDYLDRLRRALATGGRVALVDYRDGDLPVGPPPGHKLSRADVIGEFEEAGWSLAGESEALPYQYVLVFVPPAAPQAGP